MPSSISFGWVLSGSALAGCTLFGFSSSAILASAAASRLRSSRPRFAKCGHSPVSLSLALSVEDLEVLGAAAATRPFRHGPMSGEDRSGPLTFALISASMTGFVTDPPCERAGGWISPISRRIPTSREYLRRSEVSTVRRWSSNRSRASALLLNPYKGNSSITCSGPRPRRSSSGRAVELHLECRVCRSFMLSFAWLRVVLRDELRDRLVPWITGLGWPASSNCQCWRVTALLVPGF